MVWYIPKSKCKAQRLLNNTYPLVYHLGERRLRAHFPLISASGHEGVHLSRRYESAFEDYLKTYREI